MDIKLKDFEGPLDLLLHLVSKYQVDIYEVPITEVIEQYLAYVATLQAMRLEVAGEYMLMASQLMLIKSRRLLPKVAEEVLEEEDPEQALLGLTPSEIALLRQEDLQLDFQMLSLQTKKGKRIMSLPKELLPYLEGLPAGTYLFDKKGEPYSRQWLFNRLSEFVASIGHREWTAQYLRDQFILAQLAKGKSPDDLAKQLGLKSRMSLEKYR